MEEGSSLTVIVPTRSHALVEMPASVGRYVEAGLQGAANTRRGYAADLRSFEDYCQHQQLLNLPAEVATVAGYVSQLADRGLKYSMPLFAATWRPLPSSTNWPASLRPPATRP